MILSLDVQTADGARRAIDLLHSFLRSLEPPAGVALDIRPDAQQAELAFPPFADEPDPGEVKALPVSVLKVNAFTQRTLVAHQMITLGDVLSHGYNGMRRIGISTKMANKVNKAMGEYGFNLYQQRFVPGTMAAEAKAVCRGTA